ncbi:MAG TPA: hypothetical protein VH019_03745 [Rhizomicrobium sp.]|jgi:hypothetical protein|nr:hypothetical protein [Rhizomicrobium sp.]
MTIGGLSGLDSVLLSYYQAQQNDTPSAVAAANAVNTASSASSANSATANDNPPWNNPITKSNAQTAKILSTTNFVSTTNVPLSAGATSNSKLEQDNQKLFSVYNTVGSLNYLAQLAQSSTETPGQLVGLNTRFQQGLSQLQQYLSSTSFNNYNVQTATPSSSVTSTAEVPLSNNTYNTQQLVSNANLNNPVPGLSASSSFTIGVTKGGATTNVAIDLSQVQGPLTLGNIVIYINSQLSADGFSTRFQKTETGGTPTDDSAATYGLQIIPGANENIALSAASTPALWLVGDSGAANEVDTTSGTGTNAQVTTTPADESGRITKISNLSGTPASVGSTEQQASTGTTTAQATVVDSSGNVYVLGNATGNFGNQLNQGTQDTYLTKYDSAGNVTWSKLVGSAGSASGYGIALDPAGGVVITGSTTAAVTTTSITNGNTDSFVASYDANGNQNWIQQIQTLATNQANAVSVDASGNVYIGGSVSGGVIGKGQTSTGTGDAYLAEYSSKGKLVSENQFGTSSGSSQVSATTVGSDGSLYVASVQNGDAVVSKYASGAGINSAPVWTQDLGALQSGGAIASMTVSGSQVYVSGTTSNGNLTAGGQASVANAATGGTDAFVFNLTDNGSSATPDFVSYVGTSASEQGGAVTVGPDGTIYLAGTTTGTLPGQTRSIQNTSNAFAAALNANGTIAWTQQFGGASGQSTGAAVAVDPSGSSVLDALGLPRGTIDLNESVDLTSQTTLRAGDTFQIKVEGPAPRTATITIGPNDTLDSLITQINGELGGAGKASLGFSNNAESLKIAANPGQTIDLISGPADSDALLRLGIAAGVLSAPAKSSSGSSSTTTSTSSSSSSKTTPTYGLGLSGTMDISTKTGADLARSTLLSMMSNIQSIYQKSNATPAAAAVGNNSGTASASTTSQIASYNLALSLLGTSSSDAVNNIMTIVNGGTVGATGTSSSSDSALLSLL